VAPGDAKYFLRNHIRRQRGWPAPVKPGWVSAANKKLHSRLSTADGALILQFGWHPSAEKPRTDESAERLADASVAPGRSLPFLLSVLGGLEPSRLGVENPSEDAPSTKATQTL
jgi:hypothetical protein